MQVQVHSILTLSSRYFFQIEALPEIVEAVKDYGVEVYLDGGVTTGTDVYKALALGAKMVGTHTYLVITHKLLLHCFCLKCLRVPLQAIHPLYIPFHLASLIYQLQSYVKSAL